MEYTSQFTPEQVSNSISTLDLNPKDQKIIAEWAEYKAPADALEMEVWANHRALFATGGPTVRLLGICPVCGLTHGFSLGGYGPVRWPHCHSGLFNKQEVVLRFQPGPVPHDVRFALDNEAEDLALEAWKVTPKSHGARVLPLVEARDRLRQTSKPLTTAERQEAIRKLMLSGIMDERAAIQIEGYGISPRMAYRNLLARFIRRQEKPSMRRRLAAALMEAQRMACRGEQL